MGRPTGYVGVVSSSEDQSANRVCWSDDQSADSGVVGLMGWLTGYVGGDQSADSGVGVMTSRPPVGLE